MFPGGQNLRVLREQLGLTMRDVENASTQIAQKRANDEFAIVPSRLSDIETKGVIPSIYRLYSLAVIYRRDVREILSWYGVDLNGMAETTPGSQRVLDRENAKAVLLSRKRPRFRPPCR